jgi:hypothetical protein
MRGSGIVKWSQLSLVVQIATVLEIYIDALINKSAHRDLQESGAA